MKDDEQQQQQQGGSSCCTPRHPGADSTDQRALSETTTAPSFSQDLEAAAAAAAAAAAVAAAAATSLPDSEEEACSEPEGPSPVRLHCSSSSNSSSSSSGNESESGEAESSCVVGVSSSLCYEGAPVCQATAASGEGPLGGPSPLGAHRRLKSGYIPYNPYGLSRLTRQLLELTELPFMILWVYFAYFLVIVALTAHKVKSRVWLSALVAGTLVGIGLNANAYRAIMYRGYPDVGIIVRFFLIPFGVSALSGLTHSLREQFLLVFPVDPIELLIAITVPTVVVCSLLLSRIALLYRSKIPVTLRNFFLNGTIYS